MYIVYSARREYDTLNTKTTLCCTDARQQGFSVWSDFTVGGGGGDGGGDGGGGREE